MKIKTFFPSLGQEKKKCKLWVRTRSEKVSLSHEFLFFYVKVLYITNPQLFVLVVILYHHIYKYITFNHYNPHFLQHLTIFTCTKKNLSDTNISHYPDYLSEWENFLLHLELYNLKSKLLYHLVTQDCSLPNIMNYIKKRKKSL